MADKSDLRKRFTPHREALSADDANVEYARLAAELGESIGKTVKVAIELGLLVADRMALKLGDSSSATRSASRSARGAASAFRTAKERLPDLSGQTAAKLTDLVVSSGFAALRAVQETVRSTRRQG
jgi:hypothetical protein